MEHEQPKGKGQPAIAGPAVFAHWISAHVCDWICAVEWAVRFACAGCAVWLVMDVRNKTDIHNRRLSMSPQDLPEPEIVKEGKTTTEWKALIGGVASTVALAIPVAMKIVPADGIGGLIIGIVALVCTYILGRGWVKGKASTAKAAHALALASLANGKPVAPPNP